MKKVKPRIISPEYEADFAILSKIAFDVWPKERFNTIEGLSECKLFYNNGYNRLLEELNILLNMYHPAGWVRESYVQLEIWSAILHSHENNTKIKGLSGPYNMAPVGRYGWRYVLEICLEKVKNTTIDNALRPQKKDISKVFSLLVALSHSSEYSNYFHYFKENLTSVQLQLHPHVLVKGPTLNSFDSLFFENLKNYIGERPDWKEYKEFAIDSNDRIMEMINGLLTDHFGFSLTEVTHLVKVFANRITLKLGASILVTTYTESVLLFSKYSGFDPMKVKYILDFILLDAESNSYQNRDFLSRSQTERMLNYGGAILHLSKNLETIYSPEAAKYDFVSSSTEHIILTPTLLGEWLDIFISRLVYGQREDLKNLSKEINQKISGIEEFFHRNIFETELKNMITKKGYLCTSIEKIEGKLIECGEIDIIAYHPSKNILIIIEAKYHAPAKDARSMGKVISDHFRQKKYHQKFLKKISWLPQNIDKVSNIFKSKFNTQIQKVYNLESYFITGSSNAVKFLVKDYKVLTFFEFDKIL